MKPLWTKRIRSIGWLSLAATGLVLLVAGVSKKNNKECKDVKVEVTGVNRHIFIDEKEVLKLLNANGDLIGQPIADINLQVLEGRLENDKWIRNAELFFDNNEVLEVKVEEREPIARVFTVEGNSFYIDSSTSRLPLSDKMSVRVPMFTSFPTNSKKLRSKDSTLLVSIKELATYIQADSFWNAQVAQINITANRTFEMIPTIGNHTVLLGKATDISDKFDRLMSFYKQVWTRVGLDKYTQIDVQYKGQVVATRAGASSISVDSTKANEAFYKLLNASKPDTIERKETANNIVRAKDKVDDKKTVASSTTELAKRVKTEIAKVDAKKKEEKPKDVGNSSSENKKQPKAVMNKKAK